MRNVYLMGAHELTNGVNPRPANRHRNTDLAAMLDPAAWFDSIAARLNPDRARGLDFCLNIRIDGIDAVVFIGRQTEFARINAQPADAAATVTASQAVLDQLLGGELDLATTLRADVLIVGDSSFFQLWLDLHDPGDAGFQIVRP